MRSEKNPWMTRLGHAILQGDVSSLLQALEEGDDPNVPAIPTEWTIQPLGLALLMIARLTTYSSRRFVGRIQSRRLGIRPLLKGQRSFGNGMR